MRERLELQGEKVCGGIGAGKLFFIDRKHAKIPHIDLKAEEIESEIKLSNDIENVVNCLEKRKVVVKGLRKNKNKEISKETI